VSLASKPSQKKANDDPHLAHGVEHGRNVARDL
jgi:hypothetical protein